MRTIWVIFNVIIWTVLLGGGGTILSIFEWRGKILGKVAHIWSKLILASAGVKYSVYGLDQLDSKQNYVFAGNHESPFDIPLAFAGIKHHLISISKIGQSHRPPKTTYRVWLAQKSRPSTLTSPWKTPAG